VSAGRLMWSRPKQLITAPARNEYAAGKWRGPLASISLLNLLYAKRILLMQIAVHTIRAVDGGTVTAKLNRSKAIKAMCTECMGFEGNPSECTSALCPLFPWRGKILLAWKKEPVQQPQPACRVCAIRGASSFS